MSWEMYTETRPIARKNYKCNALELILNSGLGERDFDAKDWQAIENAKKEGGILKGTRYIKVKGKWEGEFDVFRARPDMSAVCEEYYFYED